MPTARSSRVGRRQVLGSPRSAGNKCAGVASLGDLQVPAAAAAGAAPTVPSFPGAHRAAVLVGEFLELVGDLLVGLLQHLSQRPGQFEVLVRDESHRVPGLASAACAADAVDVRLDVLGRVVIDYELDPRDVVPAAEAIGRHEDADVAIPKAGKRMDAILLGLVRMHPQGLDPMLAQPPCKVVHACLGLAKDKALASATALLTLGPHDSLPDLVELVGAGGEVEDALVHRFARGQRLATNPDEHRLHALAGGAILLCEALHLLRPGR
mmetsp:Transcript_19511/g.58376  ORF Transcript_19511/g.58376 Transcript_19511/m.58376 type:complete len:267 (-) Transcript_19511:521-1321(-)